MGGLRWGGSEACRASPGPFRPHVTLVVLLPQGYNNKYDELVRKVPKILSPDTVCSTRGGARGGLLETGAVFHLHPGWFRICPLGFLPYVTFTCERRTFQTGSTG